MNSEIVKLYRIALIYKFNLEVEGWIFCQTNDDFCEKFWINIDLLSLGGGYYSGKICTATRSKSNELRNC